MDVQTDRAAGVLVGSAVGDALGAGYEFGSAPFPGAPAMIGGGLGDFAPGEWTDDTAQAMAIARVVADGVDPGSPAGLDAVATGFADWFAGGPPDVGTQTREVLTAAGPRPSAARMIEAAQRLHARTGRSAGNGSLMRTGPVALAHLEDPVALVRSAEAVSALTHTDPLAGQACALWCLLVAEAVRTGTRPDPAAALTHLADPTAWSALLLEAEREQPGTFTANTWVIGALQAAWSAITHADGTFPDTMRVAIGIGEDTDTVAAIAGALVGAWTGAAAIPAEWIAPLHGWPGLRAADLARLARGAVAR